MAFWRPGAPRPPSHYSDREGGGHGINVYNEYSTLSFDDQRRRLPIYASRQQILYLVEKHAVVVLVGHTGCGKSTQVPQYLCEAGWAGSGRMVACTQPRRVAVQTVAQRVAEEMRVALGQEVGYAIRFQDVTTSDRTKIKFLTDGVLIREMMQDPLLTRYSVVMVDEAHERSMATDLLMGLLKKVQQARPDLRLVIASATVDAEALAAFFGPKRLKAKPALLTPGNEAPPEHRTAAIISVEGRSFPVEALYLEEPTADYVQEAVETVLKIHRYEESGDVLVFLTGQEEIERSVEMLNEAPKTLDRVLLALPLYAGLPSEMQKAVFTSAPRGTRKVIVATNVAETSITVNGIAYVVDCGFVKESVYDPTSGHSSLCVAPLSRASAIQRAGRAGRTRPGKVFRLYTEEHYCDLVPAQQVPEMQRGDLINIVLQLKALGVDNLMRFEWLAPPPPEMVLVALELLYALGALDDDCRLTRPLGFRLAELPVSPMLGKSLLVSGELQCSEELCIIAAMLSVKGVFALAEKGRKEAASLRLRFAVEEGDAMTYLNIFLAFKRVGSGASRWCQERGLGLRALARAEEVCTHLRRALRRAGVAMVSCREGGHRRTGADDDSGPVRIRKALCAGFFANAAILVEGGSGVSNVPLYRRVRDPPTTGHKPSLWQIHPTSVMTGFAPKCLVYNEIQRTRHGSYISELTPVEPEWLAELAPRFYENRREQR